MVKLKHKHKSVILTLQPNRSANWQQNKIIIMVMAAFVMSIAIAWSTVGVWIILPFAGFELGLLAFLMHRVSYSTYQKQIITINLDTVIFQAGVYYPKRFHSFNRDKLFVKTIEAQSEFEQTHITLDDGHQAIVIGQFLNQPDRVATLDHLKKAKLHIHIEKWWKTR
jgi:uncharacterized membrane protein